MGSGVRVRRIGHYDLHHAMQYSAPCFAPQAHSSRSTCATINVFAEHVINVTCAQLILGLFHVTDIFPNAPVYGWYLSATAIPLNLCWSLHNVVAWMKMQGFVGRKTKIVYLTTLALAQPYWVLELYADFAYFNNINDLFLKTRPWEALCR